MNDIKKAIELICNNIDIYIYNESKNYFQVKGNENKHNLIFKDLNSITSILEKNDIKYIIDEKNYSIKILD